MSLLGNATRQGGKIMAIGSRLDVLIALKAKQGGTRATCGLLDLDSGIISFWFADGTAQRYKMKVNDNITLEEYRAFAITNGGRKYTFRDRTYSILALLHNSTPVGVDL